MTAAPNAFDPDIIAWLLKGDVSIQYQTWRYLLDEDRPGIQARIAEEGWGSRFLRCRNSDGSWGERFYQPKWTSTHYTLLDLKTLCIAQDHPLIRESIRGVFDDFGADSERAYAIHQFRRLLFRESSRQHPRNSVSLNVSVRRMQPQLLHEEVTQTLRVVGQRKNDGATFRCASVVAPRGIDTLIGIWWFGHVAFPSGDCAPRLRG